MTYVGSKNKYAKDLLPIILRNRQSDQWYVEPFCGGCNLIDKVPGKRIANDAHPYLIELLIHAQNKKPLVDTVTEELYRMVKNNMNAFTRWFVGFVGFGCSFGSKWFGGYARNAKGANYALQFANSLVKQHAGLHGIEFRNMPYEHLEIPDESVIYFDPPYAGTTPYKEYGKPFDHDQFWSYVRLQHLLGHQIFVSEYNAPPDFICVWQKEVVSDFDHNRGGLLRNQ